MDPLSALRRYTVGEVQFQEIEYNGEVFYAFGDIAYPKTTNTNLVVFQKPGEYYSLETLIVFWENHAIGHANYVKEAATRNVKAVTRIDRKQIQDYLSGARTQLPPHNPAEMPAGPPVSLKTILLALGEPEAKKQRLDEDGEEEARKNAAAGPVEVRALNENLTVDRIAEMRRKRQQHQKKNIVATDESASSGLMSSSKDFPKERVHKNRDNVLTGSKDLSGVLDLLAYSQKQWEMEEKKATVTAVHAQIAGGQPQSGQQRGYSRYAQETFVKEKSSGLNTEMSFVGSNLKEMQRGVFPSKSATTASPATAAPARTPSAAQSTPSSKRPSRTPIIVVPAALTAMINMYNARDVLQELKFETADKRRNENQRKGGDVVIQRVKGGQTYNIRVIDNVVPLREDDWDRVIAVFVMGPSWQFKGWKWNGNPVEIFTHVPAFHLYYDNDKPAAAVRNWNVQKIPVNLTKRHMDKARFNQIWETIEVFCKKSKPHLCQRLGIPI